MNDVNHDAERRWDEALLAAGFDVDPDTQLSGRPARELADDPGDLDDPWRDIEVTPPVLSEAQRAYLADTSPAWNAALPGQTLTGADPLDDANLDAMRAADDEIIDFE